MVPHAERAGAHDPERTMRIQHEIVNRLAAVGGVESAAFASSNDGLPLDGDGRTGAMFVEGKAQLKKSRHSKKSRLSHHISSKQCERN
jgi:hypothetical protein